MKSKNIFLRKDLIDKRSVNSIVINYSLILNNSIIGSYGI